MICGPKISDEIGLQHIVGNGEDDEHRSNIQTLDWEGNLWNAGITETKDVYLFDGSIIDSSKYPDKYGSDAYYTSDYIDDQGTFGALLHEAGINFDGPVSLKAIIINLLQRIKTLEANH